MSSPTITQRKTIEKLAAELKIETPRPATDVDAQFVVDELVERVRKGHRDDKSPDRQAGALGALLRRETVRYRRSRTANATATRITSTITHTSRCSGSYWPLSSFRRFIRCLPGLESPSRSRN